jgi:hypothetical protein
LFTPKLPLVGGTVYRVVDQVLDISVFPFRV